MVHILSRFSPRFGAKNSTVFASTFGFLNGKNFFSIMFLISAIDNKVSDLFVLVVLFVAEFAKFFFQG